MMKAQKQEIAQPLLLTVPEVAESLRVCRKTVYNLMRDNGLPFMMVRGARRVRFDLLKEWLCVRESQSA